MTSSYYNDEWWSICCKHGWNYYDTSSADVWDELSDSEKDDLSKAWECDEMDLGYAARRSEFAAYMD